MRLIDADALIEKKWQAENESCFYALDDVVSVDDINDAPTIEPKRGEWILHKARTTVGELGIDFYPAEYVCSCCGFKESMYFIDREPYNFCPNCGADMRKESK